MEMKQVDKKKYQQWLKKKRRHALRAVLRFSPYEQFKGDYGVLVWIGAHIKAVVCLIAKRFSDNLKDKECLTTYDEWFDLDHWNWWCVWVNPSFFKDWTVSVIEDGE